MTDREKRQRGLPGISAMLLLVAALVAYGFWQAARRSADVDDAINGSGAASRAWPDMRIDVNTASVSELSLLPGLGNRLGQRIIEEREARGRFASLDDLQRVSGMGDATIERLKPYAFASPTPPDK